MRRLVVVASVFAAGWALTGCSGTEQEPIEADEPAPVSSPTETAPAPPESPEPAPSPTHVAQSPGPVVEPEEPPAEPQEQSLEQTFSAMLEAIAADGEEGLLPFLVNPEAGDLWYLSDWDWERGPCSEGGPGESACVGYFVKDGEKIENIFGFEDVNGQWLLLESWVPWG